MDTRVRNLYVNDGRKSRKINKTERGPFCARTGRTYRYYCENAGASIGRTEHEFTRCHTFWRIGGADGVRGSSRRNKALSTSHAKRIRPKRMSAQPVSASVDG